MTPYASLTEPILASPITKSKKIFDNSKVTDHHAIIPTGQYPAGIEGDEKKLYHLIAMRFIGVFYPDCKFEATTVLGEAGKYEFKATGKVIVEPGWRALLPAKNDTTDEKQDENDAVLPVFTEGESGPHKPFLAKKTSQPPKPYTEGTLLRAMETAGRTVDSDELREAMKDNGIGRPSTRAAIIETLFKRGYIRRERKNLVATQAGIDLIGTINEELLKSAKLTGIWENKLRRIESGSFSPATFVREISEMMRQIVINVLTDNSNMRIQSQQSAPASEPAEKPKKPRAPRIKSIADIVCPVCGEGHVVKGRTAYGCSKFASGCTFRIPFEECAADATPGQVNKTAKKKAKK